MQGTSAKTLKLRKKMVIIQKVKHTDFDQNLYTYIIWWVDEESVSDFRGSALVSENKQKSFQNCYVIF